jgi:hydroxymethylglutaryl-CoA reductase (NADPH)
LKHQGYRPEQVRERRRWIEEQTGCRLTHVGSHSISTEHMRGNIENPIGVAQVPVGVAGPLLINGDDAQGTFYVPLATTEGALIRSYERGMLALTRAGGVSTHIYIDENRVSPVFFFDCSDEAFEFTRQIQSHFEAIMEQADSTTRHGHLLRLHCDPIGREVIVHFCYSTGDAHGMNMIVKATEHASKWITQHLGARRFYIFSGSSSEKRASGALLAGGKGKKVSAGALLPAPVLKSYLHVSPKQIHHMWQHTMIGHVQANAIGYNGHYANGLTAIFIACGQDVANVVNAAVGITNFELTETGDLYASVTLPALTVATVGGGTGLGTSRECLELIGCYGTGRARKFAEIVTATVLAGELSMGAAIASSEFVAAHESYGRNRPSDKTTHRQ